MPGFFLANLSYAPFILGSYTVDGLNSVGYNFRGFCGGSDLGIPVPTKW